MTPSRKGRFYDISDWAVQYDKKKASMEEVVAQIRDHDVIAAPGGGTWPKVFDQALAKHLRQNQLHITLRTLFMLEHPAILAPDCRDLVQFESGFLGRERELLSQGNVDFVPHHLGHATELFQRISPRVVVMAVSPPDENGWMSRSIWGTHITRDTFENPACEIVVLEVNKQLPYLYSDGDRHTMVHVSEADYIVECDYSWPEVKSPAPTETEQQIAAQIADIIPNGACLQLGFGSLANAVGASLVEFDKHDLGLQTEVMTNCIVDLMEKGIINNSRKQLYPGRAVAAALVGDKRLWDFCHKNPDVCMKEIDWVNSPINLSRNDRVISVNSAMEIDLYGQVASETVGRRQYTGTGGQLQWVVGAQWSAGGKSIIAMSSTYFDKKSNCLRSKIKPDLTVGASVTTPRTCVQYVATEYGIVDLSYKTIRQRAEALIQIAHPDFRDELRHAAKNLY